MKERDRDDLDFERIAGLRAFDEDRTGQRVRSGRLVRDRRLDGLQRRRNLVVFDAGVLQPLYAARDHRLDAHAIAGCDPQRRREARVEVAPVHVRGRKRKIVHAALESGLAALKGARHTFGLPRRRHRVGARHIRVVLSGEEGGDNDQYLLHGFT